MIEVAIQDVFVINEGKHDVIQIDGGVLEVATTDNVNIDVLEIDENFVDVTQEGNNLIEVETENVDVIDLNQGKQGPQGEKGDAGATNVLSTMETSGEAINATTVVYRASDGKVYKADSDTLAHAESILGIAKTSVIINSSVEIITFGEESDGAYSVYPDESKLFLNGAGTLSATAPTTGFSVVVARKSDSTTIFVDIDRAIILN